MPRKIIASVLALSMAFSGAATVPARAGNDEINRFIAGAITLFIIGKAIEESNKRKKPAVTRPRPTPLPLPAPAPKPPALRGFVPNECYFTLPRPGGGRRGVYGQACLKEVMLRPERLPRACLQTVQLRYGRPARVYGAKCLRNHGFEDEARLR